MLFWIGALIAISAALVVGASTSLPPLGQRAPSKALADTQGTALGRAATRQVQAHSANSSGSGESGFFAMPDPRHAFATRMLLAKAAERSLDVQYYIWHHDATGILLMGALREAAQRGVRVRLLLDDNNTAGLDEALAALDAEPNIEVRLFNPNRFRAARWLGYVFDFSRANRRMHNKSFTADNQATIVGGRNIGDEYFGAGDGVLFTDLDVLAIGEIVPAVSNDFDRYWASASSYPVAGFLQAPDAAQRATLEAAATQIESAPSAKRYTEAIEQSPFVARMLSGDLALQWAPIRLVSDDPAKGLGEAHADAMFPVRLKQALGDPMQQLLIVSPYFVPTEAGATELGALAQKGVDVRALTNSLEATDVRVVHAGYAKWRRQMLEAGIGLYEMRGEVAESPAQKSAGIVGSSAASLHAKTFAVDHSRVFIGSFNFDPRSARLNTELGFVIESAELAATAETVFAEKVPAIAYEVELTGNGDMVWIEQQGGARITHTTEPGTGFIERAWIGFLSLLPIEWML